MSMPLGPYKSPHTQDTRKFAAISKSSFWPQGHKNWKSVTQQSSHNINFYPQISKEDIIQCPSLELSNWFLHRNVFHRVIHRDGGLDLRIGEGVPPITH